MVAGPAQTAIRHHVHSGQRLHTPSRSAPFVVGRIDAAGVTLLLGQQKTATPLAWDCWEGVIQFLSGKGWVEIGGRYSVDADPRTLDGFLKGYIKRATAGWVAAVLEAAGLVEIDGGHPAKVRSIS